MSTRKQAHSLRQYSATLADLTVPAFKEIIKSKLFQYTLFIRDYDTFPSSSLASFPCLPDANEGYIPMFSTHSNVSL